MALIKCPECGKEISDKSKVCINCGYPLDQFEKKDNIASLEEETNSLNSNDLIYNTFKKEDVITSKMTFKNFFKKHMILIVIVLVVLMAASIAIPVSISTSRKNIKYDKLIYEMEHFDVESNFKIEEYLDELPENYKNTSEIRIQFKLIKNNCDILYDGVWVSKDITKSDKARKAYINLLTINNSTIDWNLSNFLENQIGTILFGIQWTGWFDFYWYPQVDGTYLQTDLPNNKDSSKEYYYKHSVAYNVGNVVFGYKNKDDSQDEFDAYKFYSLSYNFIEQRFYVQVDCYSNNEIYKLHADFQ